MDNVEKRKSQLKVKSKRLEVRGVGTLGFEIKNIWTGIQAHEDDAFSEQLHHPRYALVITSVYRVEWF
jgi:hypothetical protein